MIDLKTITMRLIDGDSDGIRICRVEGESLFTVIIPRNKVAEAKQLPEIPSRGIYYLLDEDHGVINSVYAGQTVQGIKRLDDHKAKKDFWNKAIMFLTDNQDLSQDALNGLEAKAIEYIAGHGDYVSRNSDVPKPYVSPYSEGYIEKLHDDVLFRMAALGYDLDRVYAGPAVSAIFHTKKLGVNGRGRYDKEAGKFTVLAGSEVALDRPIIKNQAVITARRELFGDSAERAVLEDDVTFPTPSAAAVFVLGGSQNGWAEWVDDNGNTLSDVYRTEEI
jgi:hypothetical protein